MMNPVPPVIPNQNINNNTPSYKINKSEFKFVLFRIGNCNFASLATEICEVLVMPKLLPLANVKNNSSILGVVNIRGNVIPIVNLHERYKQEYNASSQYKLIIVNIDLQYIGFPVDYVETKLTNGTIEENEHSITNKYVITAENKYYLFEPRLVFKVDERNYLKNLIKDFEI